MDQIQDNYTITNTAQSSELNIYTVKRLTLNGITYEPEFTSDGFKIPVTCISSIKDNFPVQMVYYLMIPKEEIIKCFKEYLPEIINPECIKKTDDVESNTTET